MFCFPDLKVTKVVYDGQKKSFNERWEKLEEGKRKMKNNLYKYNNIVKVSQEFLDCFVGYERGFYHGRRNRERLLMNSVN